MRINLRYQIVLFSDYSGVKDDEQTKEFFFSNLKEYCLSIKPLIETAIGPTGVSNQSRPSFQTSDGSFSIAIHTDKAVFEYVYTNINVSTQKSMNDFIMQVVDVCDRVPAIFNRLYKRIGLIRVTFIDGLDTGLVYNTFFKNIKYFEGLEMKDWSIFSPASVRLRDGRSVNATSRLSRINTIVMKDSKKLPFDGVSLVTDINTLSSNTVDNISWSDLKDALQEMQQIEYEITNQTCHAIEGTNTR